MKLEAAIPDAGITSKALYEDEHVKAILFGFARGGKLAEHKAPLPVILHFVRGSAKITLEDDTDLAEAGTWIHMQPNLPHSIVAETEAVMLLMLLKSGKSSPPKPAAATA